MDRIIKGTESYQKPTLEVIDLTDQITLTVDSLCVADGSCSSNNCTTAFDNNVCWTEWQA